MSKQSEHLIAVVEKALSDSSFVIKKEKAAISRAFKSVAAEYGVNESTVRDKCTRRLGLSSDEFFNAVVGLMDGTNTILLSKLSPDEAAEVTKLITLRDPTKRQPAVLNPLPEAEVIKCVKCGSEMPPDARFCPRCGSKAEIAPVTFAKTPATHKCYNTVKGIVSVMDKTIYFVWNKRIYTINPDGKSKARLVFSENDFYTKGMRVPKDTQINELNRINCWNGKLYFYCYYRTDRIDINGVFSFDPLSRVLNKVYHSFPNGGTISQGKAYYFQQAVTSGDEKYAQFITANLDTGTETNEFMPIIAPRDWKTPAEKDEKNITRWNEPVIQNGYVYTSMGGGATLSVRFVVDNPGSYTLLPYNTIIFKQENNDMSSLFAPYGTVLMLADFHYKINALNESTMTHVESFNSTVTLHSWLTKNWVQYGDVLAVECDDPSPKHGTKCALFNISNPKYIGNTDMRYAEMIDCFYSKGCYYTLGDFYEKDEDGDYDYNNQNLALYIIPESKLFRPDTNLNSYAQILF